MLGKLDLEHATSKCKYQLLKEGRVKKERERLSAHCVHFPPLWPMPLWHQEGELT